MKNKFFSTRGGRASLWGIALLFLLACNLPFAKENSTTRYPPNPVNPTPEAAHEFHATATHDNDMDLLAEGEQPGWLFTVWNDSGKAVASIDVYLLNGTFVKTLHPGEMEAVIYDNQLGGDSIDGVYFVLPDARRCVRFQTIGSKRLYACTGG